MIKYTSPVFGSERLDVSPKGQSKKDKINTFYFINIKNIYFVKDNVKRMKRQTTDVEKIFEIIYLIKGFISRIYKIS